MPIEGTPNVVSNKHDAAQPQHNSKLCCANEGMSPWAAGPTGAGWTFGMLARTTRKCRTVDYGGCSGHCGGLL